MSVESEEGSASQKFAEEGYDYKDKAVTGAVCNTVKETGPGLVAKGEGLDAAHHNAVCNDKADIDGQLFVDGVGGFEGLQDLVHQDNHHGNHNQLHDDTHAAGDGLSQQ